MTQKNGSFGMAGFMFSIPVIQPGLNLTHPWQVFGCDTDGPPLVALEVMFARQVCLAKLR